MKRCFWTTGLSCLLLLLSSCVPEVGAEPGRRGVARGFVLAGARLPGNGPAVDVWVEEGWIREVRPAGEGPRGRVARIELSGQWLAPGFIDSHVHLAYLRQAEAHARGGVVAAVDLASPLNFLVAPPLAPRMVLAGPMLTSVAGYPTRGWGRAGYGAELDSSTALRATIDQHVAYGAGVLKVAVDGPEGLDDEQLRTAAERGLELGLPTVAHALGDGDALRAARAGIAGLAHTPVQALRPETVEAWADGAVISTLSAFGGSRTAVENLTRLRAAGATVLYGTDFGNSRVTGIDPNEIYLLQRAGLDGAAILEAGTSAPAAFFGLSELGAIEPGRHASLLILAADPVAEPLTLATPLGVYIEGEPY